MHCWWGESASYVLSLLKSFLMAWKPYILFPNEAQEWQTAPSYGYLRVAATSPSRAAPREPAGDAGPGQHRQELMTWPQQIWREEIKSPKAWSGGGSILICNLCGEQIEHVWKKYIRHTRNLHLKNVANTVFGNRLKWIVFHWQLLFNL